ncbi:TOMM precursor leader peptide-binding protein [Corynebacterium sp. A21]|uniref:TOMM precursor leader peptide-binding protein n=1 Tax=Corynebacterium sp. A21 TaxID=3457318 RepID=UPI003FD48FC3
MIELILAPGAHVFLRGRDAVQFGVDATRAGVIETDQAPGLASALLGARRPMSRTDLETKIKAVGFSMAAARSLVADLVSYRILVAPPGGSLIILGRSRLARSTASLAEESGMSVRAPLLGESEYSYLSHADVDVPVLVIDRLAHSRTMAPLLSRFARTWVPAAILDGRGVIGPLRIRGEGPCPMCLDLHRSDRDGRWYPTVSQLPGGPHTPDPLTLAATAARVVTVAQQLLGRHLEPPGSPRRQLLAGSYLEVDPRSPADQYSIITPHPRCPVCWYY